MRTTMTSRGIAFARGLSAFLVVTTVAAVRPAASAPADIFSQAAPMIGADPPKAATLGAGDASVSTQTGALEYSYPIAVPPGRNGMAPKIALTYSSQGAIYGGIASGWSMPIPVITEDFSVGRLQTRSPEVEAYQQINNIDHRADDRFVSSLAGGQLLVAVTEPWTLAPGVYKSYRARADGSFSRYERMAPNQLFRWRVRTTDGMTLIFGDSSISGQGTAACTSTDEPTNLVSDRFAPITSMIDAFGNEVRFDYEQVTIGECRIKQIVWGQNVNAGVTQPFARIAFTWTTPSSCTTLPPIPTNAQIDYRSGRAMVTGASKLVSIVATAFPIGTPQSPEHTRQITLQYNDSAGGSESCTQGRAPVRQLASIQESAWTSDVTTRVDLPPITFTYNPATVLASSLPTSAPAWGDVVASHANTLAWGYRRQDNRWPSVEAMMLDVDGDGLLDRVFNPQAETAQSSCLAQWTKNQGNGTWSGGGTITLPRLKWRGTPDGSGQVVAGGASAYRTPGANADVYEGCSLNGQVTEYKNSNGGIAGQCHVPAGAAAIPCTVGYTCPGGTRCPLDLSGPFNDMCSAPSTCRFVS